MDYFFFWLMAIVGVGAFIGVLWCLWMLRCNEVTYRDRMAIIAKVCDDPSLSFSDVNAVTYDQHMYAVAFLRNPVKLYTPKLNWRK